MFVWDADLKEFVHYSEASYCEGFLVYDSKIFTIHFVTTSVTPYHIQMWICKFGTKDISEAGKRLYCKKPVSFDEGNFLMKDSSLKLKGNELDVVIGNHEYLYSDDIRCIEDQMPNPDYEFLYKKWENQFDSGKFALRGMIT